MTPQQNRVIAWFTTCVTVNYSCDDERMVRYMFELSAPSECFRGGQAIGRSKSVSEERRGQEEGYTTRWPQSKAWLKLSAAVPVTACGRSNIQFWTQSRTLYCRNTPLATYEQGEQQCCESVLTFTVDNRPCSCLDVRSLDNIRSK